MRILGILQRLSLAYAAVLLVHAVTGYGNKYRRKLAAIFMFGLYFVYLSAMLSFDGSEKIGPHCSKANNLSDGCNFVGYVDHLILTDGHCWKGGYTDPEGTISTIGAIITTYMGYEFSLIMGRYKAEPRKLIANWLVISVVFGLLVYPVSLLMALNKKLYSASFILVVVAVSGGCLTFFYFVVDILPSVFPACKKAV